jgi:hypothetical protein
MHESVQSVKHKKQTLCHQRMKIMKKGTPTGMMQNTADHSAAKLKRSGHASLKSDLPTSQSIMSWLFFSIT